MSDTATRKTVQPRTPYVDLLDKDRVEFYNYRLNINGRKTISRMHSDQPKLLLTVAGYNMCKTLGLVKEEQMNDKIKSMFKKEQIEKYFQNAFYYLVPIANYDKFIGQMYSEPANISIRSNYVAKEYFSGLNEYGSNRNFVVPDTYIKDFVGALNNRFLTWFSSSKFDFNLQEYAESLVWLSHIKTGSNSGYPTNEKQTKELMKQYWEKSIKVFEAWKRGARIDWKKLSFEMGYRTERKGKHRTVCMAATLEKIISAIINSVLDEAISDFPLNIPKKVGSNLNVINMMREHITDTTLCCTKDFEGFDKHVPLKLFIALRDWLKQINNTFSLLVAFEVDVIIHSYMIVAPTKSFYIAALPSGIGVTQFIGSIIHVCSDDCSGLDWKIAFYQSDDNTGVTTLNIKELNDAFKYTKDNTGMIIADAGKKTYVHPKYSKFLQKILDFENHIMYNHEQRAFTNGIFRERQLNADERFEVTFGLVSDDRLTIKRKAVLAYLGNLVSYEIHAPSLPNIITFMYGKKTGIAKNMIEWGLLNLEKYVQYEAEEETHKIPSTTGGWLRGTFEQLLQYGWTKTDEKQVSQILESLGRNKLLW